MKEYLAVDCGGYLCLNSFSTLIVAWQMLLDGFNICNALSHCVCLWMVQILDTKQREAEQREAEQREAQAAEEAAANTNSNATVNGANETQDEVDSRDDQKSKVCYVECFDDVSRSYLCFNCSWLIYYYLFLL